MLPVRAAGAEAGERPRVAGVEGEVQASCEREEREVAGEERETRVCAPEEGAEEGEGEVRQQYALAGREVQAEEGEEEGVLRVRMAPGAPARGLEEGAGVGEQGRVPGVSARCVSARCGPARGRAAEGGGMGPRATAPRAQACGATWVLAGVRASVRRGRAARLRYRCLRCR
jgi:hypothetical protein